jgi:hypothetical protein
MVLKYIVKANLYSIEIADLSMDCKNLMKKSIVYELCSTFLNSKNKSRILENKSKG